jgi:hypothetical protein
MRPSPRSNEVVKCLWCGSDFHPLLYDPGVCCSRKCAGLWRRSQPIDERFWTKVRKGDPDECWPWIGATDGHGYGTFWNGGKLVLAHRTAWMLTKGLIPGGMNVLHRCDNRPCCNPNHHFLGTYGDNCRDRTKKGRTAKGEKHGRAKLTEAQAIEILARSKAGESHRLLAHAFQVSRSTIQHLVQGRSWSHLQAKAKGA